MTEAEKEYIHKQRIKDSEEDEIKQLLDARRRRLKMYMRIRELTGLTMMCILGLGN